MRRWQWKIQIQRDTNYYFGLFLLVIASASLIWAIWKDAFEPHHFLVYFLVYAWGYILLLKSDTEYRFSRLEKKITEVLARLEDLENSREEGEAGHLPSGELFTGPGGVSGEPSTGDPGGIFGDPSGGGSGDSPAGGSSESPVVPSGDGPGEEPAPPENGD
ncbi:MAG: hypothetical protein GX036_03875 [Firmicutes bacterium]|jgi:hypothetical protein|nr:hypothetical protein [Bacillota bacterium]